MNDFDLRSYDTVDDVRLYISTCQKANHTQQVAYSTYHDSITQICFTCGLVRTNIKDERIAEGIDTFNHEQHEIFMGRKKPHNLCKCCYTESEHESPHCQNCRAKIESDEIQFLDNAHNSLNMLDKINELVIALNRHEQILKGSK